MLHRVDSLNGFSRLIKLSRALATMTKEDTATESLNPWRTPRNRWPHTIVVVSRAIVTVVHDHHHLQDLVATGHDCLRQRHHRGWSRRPLPFLLRGSLLPSLISVRAAAHLALSLSRATSLFRRLHLALSLFRSSPSPSFTDTKEGRYNPKMHPVIPVHNWRKGSQWGVLTRKHAKVVVEDEIVLPMFQKYCKKKPLPEFWRDQHIVIVSDHGMTENDQSVDIAPTLALLFGVPIPKNNIGVLISQMVESLTVTRSNNSSEGYNNIVATYYQFMSKASEWLCHKAIDKPINLLVFGVAALITSCLLLLRLAFIIHKEVSGSGAQDLGNYMKSWKSDEVFILVAERECIERVRKLRSFHGGFSSYITIPRSLYGSGFG
ncbi:hypothetical protein RIF29_29154 [Crotalaria pallida]|uniref:Uncharacterized protein n=1 Tax=Crotalaria pallida TaxID=3830 RepID=A0AAN9EJ83_CROPI